jgi:hypothetical protein
MKIRFMVILFTFTLPGWGFAQSDFSDAEALDTLMKYSYVKIDNNSWQPEKFQNATVVPAAYAHKPLITLDGKDDEFVWNKATEISIPLSYGFVPKAWIKALYSDDEVFIRVRWEDATENREHHPWVWDSEKEQYVEGPQVEDSLILSIEGGCWWTPSFLEGQVFDFDGWQWLAARSDPVGQAVDIDGSVYDRPFRKNREGQLESRGSREVWNVKFTEEDEGSFHKSWEELERMYVYQPALETMYYRGRADRSESWVLGQQLTAPENAPEDENQTYPQYKAVKLEGDAGDVSAKGNWENGVWTVEFSRARYTDSETVTDSVFNRLTQFSIHIFDQVERIDQASESPRLYLQFMEKDLILTKN